MTRRRMITVFADASWCPRTRLAGWGCYVKCDHGRAERSSLLRQRPPTSTIAETMAAVNAIAFALQRFPGYDAVHVVCDCDHVVRLLTGTQALTAKPDVEAKAMADYLLNGRRLTAKHVKGHSAAVVAPARIAAFSPSTVRAPSQRRPPPAASKPRARARPRRRWRKVRMDDRIARNEPSNYWECLGIQRSACPLGRPKDSCRSM